MLSFLTIETFALRSEQTPDLDDNWRNDPTVLSFEIFRDTPSDLSSSASNSSPTVNSASASKIPTATLVSPRKVVSRHSKYLARMLGSSMREGSESTIRLTSAYPESLCKLLVALNEQQLSIASESELVLFLADEYDMASVTAALSDAFSTFPEIVATTHNSKEATTIDAELAKVESTRTSASCLMTLENASVFLECSTELRLGLGAKIFAGLSRLWWEFGPRPNNVRDYERHRQNSKLLLQSLDFADD